MIEGFEEINQRFKDLMRQMKVNTEHAVTEALISAGGYAATITPIATSTLINSQYRRTEVSTAFVDGELGYTAHYAIYVHEAPGVLKGTNTPRSPKSYGVVWGPDAEPAFLMKGVDMMLNNDFRRIVQRNLSL